MKVMICIPMEVDVQTTKRTEMKSAVQKAMLATIGEGPGLMTLLPKVREGQFLVRAPERIPGFEE